MQECLKVIYVGPDDNEREVEAAILSSYPTNPDQTSKWHLERIVPFPHRRNVGTMIVLVFRLD